MEQQKMSRIVVGLDCSAYDDAVLVAAMAEADRRTATLRIVHAIEITMLDIKAVGPAGIRMRNEQAAHIKAVRCELQQQIDATATALGVCVPVELQVERGDPATWLLGAARDADLIVAGTRSAGSGSPMLLGMVSQDVAVHSSCPVLLVPPKS